MALQIVATPIGHCEDISQRGLQALQQAEVIILEERKEGTAFLRSQGITGKKYAQLNEHTTAAELEELLHLCRTQAVALISDCGTPGFSDPGSSFGGFVPQAPSARANPAWGVQSDGHSFFEQRAN